MSRWPPAKTEFIPDFCELSFTVSQQKFNLKNRTMFVVRQRNIMTDEKCFSDAPGLETGKQR